MPIWCNLEDGHASDTAFPCPDYYVVSAGCRKTRSRGAKWTKIFGMGCSTPGLAPQWRYPYCRINGGYSCSLFPSDKRLCHKELLRTVGFCSHAPAGPSTSSMRSERRFRVAGPLSLRYYRCDLTPTPGGPRHARRAPFQRFVRTCFVGYRHPARPPARPPDAWHGICTSRGEGNLNGGREATRWEEGDL